MRCQNRPCYREAGTTVRIFDHDFDVCHPCGGRIRAVQEGYARWDGGRFVLEQSPPRRLRPLEWLAAAVVIAAAAAFVIGIALVPAGWWR